jgi:hypothetical protein
MKTYLCPKSEDESTQIIDEMVAASKTATPTDNNEGRCIIIVADTAATRAIAQKYALEDVTRPKLRRDEA